MEEVPLMEDWVFEQKHAYLGHTKSDFGSVKCMITLRLRDTPCDYDNSKFSSFVIIFFIVQRR
jgi:hypothetical protein